MITLPNCTVPHRNWQDCTTRDFTALFKTSLHNTYRYFSIPHLNLLALGNRTQINHWAKDYWTVHYDTALHHSKHYSTFQGFAFTNCSIVGIEPTEANLRWKEYLTLLYSSNHNLTLQDHREQNETEQDRTEHNFSILHKTVPHIKICSLRGLKPRNGKSARDKRTAPNRTTLNWIAQYISVQHSTRQYHTIFYLL